MARDFGQIRDFDAVRDFDGRHGFPELAVGSYQEDFQDPPSDGDEADEFFASVVALLHFDGANNDAVYTDVIGHTFAGTLQDTQPLLSTTQKQFGDTSLFCGTAGTSTGYLDTTELAEFGFGTGDFTVEMWVYPTDAPTGSQQILNAHNAGNVRFSLSLSSNDLAVANGSTQLVVVTGGLASNAWQHLAYAREGTAGKLFVNGVQKGSTASDTFNYPAAAIGITLRPDAPAFSHFRGYIDDIRITKGVARYTANFQVPSAPFPDA